jgi:4-hydroxy-2-oxoheptanedioate aldolase
MEGFVILCLSAARSTTVGMLLQDCLFKGRCGVKENRVKEKIKRNIPSVGAALAWPSPQLVEFCALAGFEWVLLDAEHGPIDVRTCEEMVRAAENSGIVTVVRVPTNDRITIMQYLQVGAMGIAVPHVNSREEAEAVVQAVKYFPQGSRYADTGARAADYALLKPNLELYEEANRETMTMIWVEERRAMQNLDEILQVEGIDAVNIGPSDLALTMGHPGRHDHPEVQQAIAIARRKILDSGKVLVGETRDAEPLPALLKLGARLISTSAKHLWYFAMKNYLAKFHEYRDSLAANGVLVEKV